MKVEVVDEWCHYDGFISGVVRITNEGVPEWVFYAEVIEPEDWTEEPWRYRARSLFHMVHPMLSWSNTSPTMPDPGVIEFTSDDFVAAGR